MKLEKLFETVQIGPLTLRNRVIMGSMHVGLEGDSQGSEALITFYKKRAREGGPGLIVTGGISVSPEGEGGMNFLGFYRKNDIEVMERLTREVHEVGGKIAAQLFHAGRYAYSEITKKEAVAPSPIKSPIHQHTPRELTDSDIEALINSFVNSAELAKQVGFDAVEIMGSEGYLINQFLSPVTNQRSDHWGGDWKRRMRFPLEIIKKIRDKVGNYPIIFRLSGNDLIPHSTTENEVIELAKAIEKAGADVLNVGIGWHESQVPTISTLVPRAGFIHVARNLKKHVSIPVIGSNRINDPQLAEDILQKGDCDIISMARPFLADPDILQKAQRSEFDRINTCVACNQACLDHVFEGKPASCLVNPLAGREHKWKLQKSDHPQKIAVIGGGAAGMEAARALAEKGEQVTLFEASNHLGGQLNLAKKIPGKEEFNHTLRYYETELSRLGVNLILNSSPTAEQLMEAGFQKVILAIGVQPWIPSIPGMDTAHILKYNEVLTEQGKIGERVAIIGAGGVGCDVAHYLIEKGVKQITVMRRQGRIGEGLGKTTRWALISHLKQHGVQFLTGLTYKEINPHGVIIVRHDETGEQEYLIEADTIIMATGQESVTWDDNVLKQAGIEVIRIGGARVAGELDAKRAIYEGARLAYM